MCNIVLKQLNKVISLELSLGHSLMLCRWHWRVCLQFRENVADFICSQQFSSVDHMLIESLCNIKLKSWSTSKWKIKPSIFFFLLAPAPSLQTFNSHFDYEEFFTSEIEKKKKDDTYRIFKKVNRLAEAFPHALDYSNTMEGKDVTVWCSNDYLGMSRHPEVLKTAM